MNLTDALRQAAGAARSGRNLQTGTIAGFGLGRYTVTVNGLTHEANSGISGLSVGDVVWVLLEQGVPKIVGLLGTSEGNTI